MTRWYKIILFSICAAIISGTGIYIYAIHKVKTVVAARIGAISYPGIEYIISSVSLFSPEVRFSVIKIFDSNLEILSLDNCALKTDLFLKQGETRLIRLDCAYGAVAEQKLRNLVPKLGISGKEKNSSFTPDSSSGTDYQVSIDKFAFLDTPTPFSGRMEASFRKRKGRLMFTLQRPDLERSSFEMLFSLEPKEATLSFHNMGIDEISWLFTSAQKPYWIKGLVDGTVNIRPGDFPEVFQVSEALKLSEGSFFHPRIDDQPMPLPLVSIDGLFTVNSGSKSIATQMTKVSFGGVTFSGAAQYDKRSVSVEGSTDRMELDQLAALFRADPAFKGFRMDGSIEISYLIKVEKEEDTKKADVEIKGTMDNIRQVSSRLDYLKKPFLYEFIARDGTVYTFEVGTGNHYTPLTSLPEWVGRAVLLCEDAGFYLHQGLDFDSIAKALKDDIEKGEMRGGSTIIQQLAKNLFLSREKTVMRKVKEAVLAIELNASLSKDRLLEIYLNIIEWGPGIFGIGAASRHYFGKSPELLDPQEAVWLASIIPNPTKYYYQYTRNAVSQNWRDFVDQVLMKMYDRDYIDYDQYVAALQTPIVFTSQNPLEKEIP